MNNKIDSVLLSLLQTKESIVNNFEFKNNNTSSYNDTIKGLDNLIVDYTLKNQMTAEEILECATSLYVKKEKTKFQKKLEQITETLKPTNLYKKVKDKVKEQHKKKEDKKRYETEVLNLVKDRLKNIIEPDKQNVIDNKEKENFIKKENEFKKVSIYNKETAEKLITNKNMNSFIYVDNNKYFVCQNVKNNLKVSEFDSLGKAVICSIDKKLSPDYINNNFDTIKNNYGDLSKIVKDKRNINYNYNYNISNVKRF